MTDHTVTLRDGPTIEGHTIRFTDPARVADYARSRRASDRADAWLSVCAYVMIGLPIVIGMAHWGLR